MRKALFYVVLVLFSLATLAGCAKKEKAGGPVVAKINKEAITGDDLITEMNRIPEWAREQFSGDEGKAKFLDELIKRELIFQDARKMGLDKDKEYLEKKEEFEKMTLVSLVLKKEIEDKALVDDREVKDFYDKNSDKFTIGTKIRASHILVETEAEAKKIHARIKKGEAFAKLAESFSKDKGSAQKGGDLGYFGQGQMVPEFEQALLRLKPNEVSDPVKTRFGYHIIQLTDIKKGEIASFEQSKESIKKQLLSEKKKTLFDAYLESLNKKYTVTKNEESLKAVKLPWEKTGGETPAPHK
ncbi:MAG: peptidylprolyl isomerase [Nitrospiraceae bacterium]|nr:MAG: peptidylprolyl isomerase [Nitrospiraceae bacterium]